MSQSNLFNHHFPSSSDHVSVGENSGSLQQQIVNLRTYIDQRISNHTHSGVDSQRIKFDIDLEGLFETVSSAPTSKPSVIYDQIKIYVNGSTYRLYWYDANGQSWHYVTATA